MPTSKKIALVLDPVSARRLAPGMLPCFKPGKRFLLLDALRPPAELRSELERWQPDGIVMRVQPETNQLLMKMRKPIVISGGNRAGPELASVSVDNEKVGAEAARQLLGLGLQSIGFFGINAPFSFQRQGGFLAALRESGKQPSVFVDPRLGWEHYMEIIEGTDEGLIEWVRSLSAPAGIFAAHDPLGWHLTEVCRQAGIAVPEEVAVIGANNDVLVCSLSSPPLTSVAIPWKRIGAELAIELDRMLEGAKTGDSTASRGQLLKIAPEGVVIRQSTDILAVDRPLLRRALAFIREHAGEPTTVSDILNHVPMSRRKLELDFVQHLKRTPKEEITRVRIERAKVILAETDLPIPMVAERCGFNYAERFTVAFRRSEGTTPQVFRKSMQPRTVQDIE